MINVALQLLRNELEAGLLARVGSPIGSRWVSLANVADLAGDDSDPNVADLNSQILLTLVNVEEETAFKNAPNFTKTTLGVRYANPPAFLNLYLLFTANFPINGYEQALQSLSATIRFFQGNNVFSLKNASTPLVLVGNDLNDPDIPGLQLTLDLYTMTFEQINHLWGSLGGKQKPFAMYKGRLVKLDDRRISGIGPVIEEIGIDAAVKN